MSLDGIIVPRLEPSDAALLEACNKVRSWPFGDRLTECSKVRSLERSSRPVALYGTGHLKGQYEIFESKTQSFDVRPILGR